MRKIITSLLSICFLFLSCQIEKLDGSENAISAETERLQKKKKKESNPDCIPDLAGLEANLPDVVSAKTTAKPGDNSYFTLEILDTYLAGANIPAWCVDVDLSLEVEGPFDFAVYSSYESLPAGSFENPENFELVNWILNQSFIGTSSPSGGNYTFGHIQWAIWELIDDINCVNCTYLSDPTGQWNSDANNVVKGQEIVQAALDNGEGFVPQCGELIGIVLIPEGKQPVMITVEVPPLECNECDGKITELELQYNGEAAANIVVKGKGKKKKEAPIIFEGVVNPGESFTIYGHDDKGTLGTEIKIYINEVENAKIHTSCSDPDVGPGYVAGDFEVIRGASRNGGELCPSDNPGGEDDCSECKGKVTVLELEYNGDSSAEIKVETKKKKPKKGQEAINPIVFEGTVAPGETFSFIGNDDKGTLGTEITIYVDGVVDQKIHTSCSVPIGPGAIFGDYTVISGASREGGELCPADSPPGDEECDCDGKLTELDLSYNGADATITVKTKGKGKNKSGATIFDSDVVQGGTIILVGNDDKGTLGTEITIYINGEATTKIHTSCSDPNVVPGYTVDDFTVIRGASRNNGELCSPDDGGAH